MTRAPHLLAAILVCAGCSSSDDPSPRQSPSAELTDLSISSIRPSTLVPGSTVEVEGSFRGDVERARLLVEGTFAGAPAEISVPLTAASATRWVGSWPGGIASGLGADDGVLEGNAELIADSVVDDTVHRSGRVSLSWNIRSALAPAVDSIASGALFVNDPVTVLGSGFLLGGDEGDTVAEVAGCFQPAGGASCDPIQQQRIVTTPEAAGDRSRVRFPFVPRIAGIGRGRFEGTVTIENDTDDGGSSAEPFSVSFDVVEPRVFEVTPDSASLGGYVDVRGGGFAGPSIDPEDTTAASTTLELTGTFAPDGGQPGPEVTVTLVPEVTAGTLARYVLNEEDQLSTLLDLRAVTGGFSGTLTPVVRYGAETATGSAAPISFSIAPVNQVVWIRFLPSYEQSLLRFGLRAADALVRARVFEVATRIFAGLNVELRSEEPLDYAAYAVVEVSGPDPNGLGLLGYDNTPGKDVGNLRLYDRIGGVNALTQEDGYPGYGGVFTDSIFGFSEHPPDGVQRTELATPLFDELFDVFRPDVGGAPVSASDIAAGLPAVTAASCPIAGSRDTRIACAIHALGSLVGSTLSHEVAHSLGLAQPEGEGFHNDGDRAGRLMDAGPARPFDERAEVAGATPSVFCRENYEYLRQILPTSDPDPNPARPGCN